MNLALVIADANKTNAVTGAFLLETALGTPVAKNHPVLSSIRVFVTRKSIVPIRNSVVSATGWIRVKKFRPNDSLVPIFIDAWGWGKVAVPNNCESPIPMLCFPCAVTQMAQADSTEDTLEKVLEALHEAAELCQRECADSDDLEVKRVCHDAVEVADMCTRFVLHFATNTTIETIG